MRAAIVGPDFRRRPAIKMRLENKFFPDDIFHTPADQSGDTGSRAW